MDRETLLNEASDLLSVFSVKVDMLSKAGYFSMNKLAESIFTRLFNSLLDLELVNINTSDEQNYPAIDLIDEKRKIAFQITSDNSNNKIYTTLDTFVSYELFRKAEVLYIYSIVKRQSRVNAERLARVLSKIPVGSKFEFRNKHIIDNVFILEKLQDLSIEKATAFLQLLRKEIGNLKDIWPLDKPAGTEIFITFSEENYPLGLRVIEGLVTRNFIVYHNFQKIQEELTLESRRNSVIYVNGFNLRIERCLAILSGNFFAERWTKHCYDPILQSALKSNAEIFVYKTSNHNLPANLQSKNILYDPIRVNEADFQKIIVDFSGKINLTEDLGQSLVWYKRFESIIRKVYPTSTIEKITADEKRGYEIYKTSDEIFFQEAFFICFHRGAQMKPNCEKITKDFPVLTNSLQKTIVLLPKERNLEYSSRRKETLNHLLNPTAIFFIEDFLIKCLKVQGKMEYESFDVNDFVEPLIIDTSEMVLPYQWLLDWFDATNKPILVIKGLGGVGKTTLVQKLANDFNSLKPDATIIYINSIEILTELDRLKIKDHDFDLYYFYNAYIDKMQNFHRQVSQLDDEMFRAALDSGNILFIIDGLDEVIAHFPQFNVDEFIKSTLNYSEDLGKGNIIITCRSYFWTDSAEEEVFNPDGSAQLSIISLQPFDDALAEQFFEAKIAPDMPNRQARIKKSMDLAKSFINPKLKPKNNGHSNRYIPFVLSIINNMMDYEGRLDTVDSNDFDTNYLSPFSKTDYITYGICAREKSKIGQINVNDQVKFFIILSISSYAGSNLKLSFEEFDSLLQEFNDYYHETARDSFKGHPLFEVDKQTREISFRYDFLAEYFKSIYVASFVTGCNDDFAFSSLTIKLIANYMRINSGFLKEISSHILEYTDKIHENIKELIFQCYFYEGTGVSEEQRKRAMSGLTAMAIILSTDFNPHIDKNTRLISEVYGNDHEINDLHIIDFTLFEDHLKTLFDFSDFTLRNCTFDNYDYFWDCQFSKNTVFINCTLKNLKDTRFRETDLTKENFRGCTMDEWIRKMLDEKVMGNSTRKLGKAKSELKAFLETFIWNGRIRAVSIKYNLMPLQNQKKKVADVKKILGELKKAEIVELIDAESGHGDKVQIVRSHEKSILDFCQNELKSKSIAELIPRIAQHI